MARPSSRFWRRCCASTPRSGTHRPKRCSKPSRRLPATAIRDERRDPKLLTSIAVLPFVFLSDVEDSRALSLGFADALITIFGNLEDVMVAPTSAILNYAAGTEPVAGLP